MGSSKNDTRPVIRDEGFTILSEPADAKVDIVILHGLNGSPFASFYHEKADFYWPTELGKQLPSARLMVYGYHAKEKGGSDNMQGVHQFAEALLFQLNNLRYLQSAQRPLIFIGHSLGGSVIKQLLVFSSLQQKDQTILSSTKAIYFLATPHRGSHAVEHKAIKLGLTMRKVLNRQIPENIMPSVQPRSGETYSLNHSFMRVKGSIAIVNFFEQSKVDRVPGLHKIVVDKDSAVFDAEDAESFPVARDHQNIVKFEDKNDNVYQTLLLSLRRKLASILADLQASEPDDTSRSMLNGTSTVKDKEG